MKKKALASVISWLRRQNISEQGFFMDYITELFCILNDFCKKFNESLEKALISDQKTTMKKSALNMRRFISKPTAMFWMRRSN